MAIRAELDLETRKFHARMDAAEKRVREGAGRMKKDSGGIGSAMAGGARGMGGMALGKLGIAGGAAASVAGISAQVKATTEWAAELDNLSLKLGETPEAIQRVQFAARAANIDFNTIADGVLEMEKVLGELNNTDAAAAFEALGLTGGELVQLPMDEKLLAISAAFQKARADGTGYSNVLRIMGESAKDLLPILNQSEEAIREMFGSADVVSAEDVLQLAETNQRFAELTESVKTFGREAVNALVEVADFWSKTFENNGNMFAAIDQIDAEDGARSDEVERRQAAKDAAGEALEAQRENAAATEAAAKAQDAQATAAKSLAEALRQMDSDRASAEMDLLPDDEKLTALERKLQALLKNTVGGFDFLDFSTDGLRDLVEKTAGANGADDDLTQGRLAQLEKALAIEEEIAKLKKDAADTEADELARLRESTAEGDFELLSEEEQARKTRDQLGQSLGLDFLGADEIAAAMDGLRAEASAARDAGDTEGEADALARLETAQGQLQDLTSFSDLAETEPERIQTVGGVASAVNSIFGRSSDAVSLDEARSQTSLLRQILTTLNKDPEPDQPDDIFTDF